MTQRVPVISPELALIDPALAEKARAGLPDPGEFFSARLPAAQAATTEAHRLPDVEPQPRRRRRTRTLGRVLVASIFLLAGFSIGRMTATQPPGFIIEQVVGGDSASQSLQQRSAAKAAASAPSRTTARPRVRTRATRRSAASGVAGARHGRGAKTASKRSPRKAAAVRTPRRSRNVLGVIVSLSPRSVTIRWRAPTSSRHVIVLRRKRGASKDLVVYRGTRPWLQDASLQPGTYTYVIVNYDRGGRASSGVPTVVEVAGSAL